MRDTGRRNRFYPIQPDQGYFDVGVTGDGRQVLVDLLSPGLVAIFFDHPGGLAIRISPRLSFWPGWTVNSLRTSGPVWPRTNVV